jgi:hypothetical protein
MLDNASIPNVNGSTMERPNMDPSPGIAPTMTPRTVPPIMARITLISAIFNRASIMAIRR